MKERLIKIVLSPNPKKKYRAIVSKGERTRSIDFGARGYDQFTDSTKLHKFKARDHHDKKRRERYFLRHSGVASKAQALQKETRKSGGLYNPKILSHKFLW